MWKEIREINREIIMEIIAGNKQIGKRNWEINAEIITKNKQGNNFGK